MNNDLERILDFRDYIKGTSIYELVASLENKKKGNRNENIGEHYALLIEFVIQDYTDIKEEIKTHILTPTNINFKAKNNFDIFNEMTREEWLNCATPVEEGRTDIEMIIEKILE